MYLWLLKSYHKHYFVDLDHVGALDVVVGELFAVYGAGAQVPDVLLILPLPGSP